MVEQHEELAPMSKGAVLNDAVKDDNIIVNMDETSIFLAKTCETKAVCLKSQRVKALPRHGETLTILVGVSTTGERLVFVEFFTMNVYLNYKITGYLRFTPVA